MTDERRRPGCLEANMLAEYIDGGLDSRARAAVEAHLAECEDCYEQFVEGARSAPATIEEAGKTVRRPTRIASVAAAIVALAAVAFLAVRVMFPSPRREASAELDRLMAASDHWRPVEGRLTSGVQWSARTTTNRADVTSEPPTGVQASGARLRLIAEEHPEAFTLRAAGVADLLLHRTSDAVAALEESVRLDATDFDARVAFVAALLQAADEQSSAFAAARALHEAEVTLALRPTDDAARFNMALALERNQLWRQARDAWQTFLTGDSTSEWAAEARDHVRRLDHRDDGEKSPAQLATRLEHDLWPEWAAAVLGGSAPPTERVREALPRLRRGDIDRSLVQIAEAMTQSEGWPLSRRQCLAAAVRDLAGRIDTSPDDGDAVARARRASANLRCAGLSPAAGLAREVYALYAAGRPAESLALADRATSTVGQPAERLDAVIFQVRGLAAMRAAKMSDALAFFKQAAARAETAADASLAATTYSFLVETLDEQGDREAAWQSVASGLRAADDGADVQAKTDVVSAATIAAGHAQLFGAALRFADELLSAPDASASTRVLAHLQRARGFSALQRDAKAAAELAAAEGAIAALPSAATREAWSSESAWIEGLVFGESDPTRAATALSRVIDYAERSNRQFRLAELLLFRGRAYRRAGQSDKASKDFRRGVDILEAQRAGIHEERLRISRTDQVWELFGELIDQAPTAEAALAMAERAKARELLGDSEPANGLPPTLADWRRALPPNACALEYVLRRDRLLVWRITAEAVTTSTVSMPADELTALVHRARAELMAGADTRFQRQLADAILPADLPASATTLIFVPDGPLHDVPFAALRRTNWSAPLVARWASLVAPSLASFVTASTRARDYRTGGAMLVGLSDPVPAANLPALSGVRDEIRAVSDLYPIRRVFDGNRTTARDILDTLPTFSTIHVATHSHIDQLAPLASRLFVSKDGASISPEEISGVRLKRGAVVVLAACDSAIGREYSGEGALNLVRPFLSAGAGVVIGTLWPADDASAIEIVGPVHEHLKKGVWPVEGLAQAQRNAMARGFPARLWAAYVAVGGMPVRSPRSPQ